MSNVKLIRLLTGEELVADVGESTSDGLRVKDVAILIPAGENSLGLAPFIPYANLSDGIQLNKDAIVFTAPPVPQLKAEYDKLYGKLLTPDTGLIINR